jgi:hypothetical protein
MINRTDSERLEVIIEKLDQIVNLLTPKETKIQVMTATDAPNGFNIDSDGNIEINEAEIKETPNSIAQLVKNTFAPRLPINKQTRKNVIRFAQDAHRILASNVYSSPDGTTFMYRTMKDGQRKCMCTADFIVSKEKRKVICLLKGVTSGKVRARGIAKCDPADVFNVDIGMAIALYRALKLNVPGDYLNVPAPTTLEVGQIVYWVSSHKFLVTKKRDNGYYDFKRLHDGKQCNNHWIGKSDLAEVTIEEDGVEV